MDRSGALAAFLPNRAVSSAVVRTIVAVQAALFFILWWTSPFEVLPKPPEVWAGFQKLWFEEGLSRELWTSFTLNLQALALTTVFSLTISYLGALAVFRPIAVAISKGRFLGLTGLSLAFLLVVGGGRPLKISLLVFGTSVFFVTSMFAVVAEIPREKLDHARTLRMGEWRTLWEVVILGTVDQAFECLRQNAAIGWMMLTMVEGISRSEGGVGTMLLNQNKHFHLAEVFAIQILILLLGLLQDWGIGALRQLTCPWVALSTDRSPR